MTSVAANNALNARQALRSEISRQALNHQDQATAAAKTKPLTTDRFDGALPRGLSGATGRSLLPVVTTDSSPFVHLARSMPDTDRATLAPRCGLERDLAARPELLSTLGELDGLATSSVVAERAGASEFLAALGRTRHGVMLGLSDAVSTHCAEGSRVPAVIAARVGGAIATLEDRVSIANAAAATIANAKSQFPNGMDVNAFVQAVLRESYLLQSEILRDHADRVKYWNELKKEIRAQLKRAREMRRLVAAGLPLPQEFVATLFLNEESSVFSLAAAEAPQTEEQGIGEIDEESNGGVDFNSTARDLPDGVMDWFVHHRRPEVGAALGGLLATLSAHRNDWYKKVEAFNQWLDDNPNGLTLLATEASSIPPWELSVLVTFAAEYFSHKKAEEGRSGELGYRTLRAVFENTTHDQLVALRDDVSDEAWELMDEANDRTLRLHFREVEDAIDLLPDWAQETDLAKAAHLYAEVKLGTPPHAAIAQAELRELMWELPAESVRVFLRGIMMEDSGGQGDLVNALLFASNPMTTLQGAAPSDWSFLAEAGGRAADLYRQWRADRVPEHMVEFDRYRQTAVALDRPPSLDPNYETTGMAYQTEGSSGSLGATPAGGEIIDLGLFDDYIEELEGELETAGGDAQLANVDMQNSLQRQQQTLQMMANISKMLHDTAMAIIRKIGS